MIQVDLWELITAAGSVLAFFLGIIFTLGKLLLRQFKDHLDRQFAANEESRRASNANIDRRFVEIDSATRKLESDFLNWKAELPLQYVRREDHVAGQSKIEAKLDAIAAELKMVQIKGRV